MTKQAANGLRFLSKGLVFVSVLLDDAAEMLDPQRQRIWDAIVSWTTTSPVGDKKDWS